MIKGSLKFCVAAVLLASSICLAQVNGEGTISGSTYKNEPYRFSLEIPAGWQAAPDALAKVKASLSDPRKLGAWLVLQPASGSPNPDTVVFVTTQDFGGNTPFNPEIGRKYVEKLVKSADSDVSLKPTQVLVSGVEMHRVTMKVKGTTGEQYSSLIATGLRDRVVVFRITGHSEQAVDDAFKMLMKAIHFQPDWSVQESAMDQGTTRVRISAPALEKLVTRKVAPRYPQAAREAHIQGRVEVNATISRQGDVQRLWVVGGPPELAGATIEAVKGWTYKPYVLNGEPVVIESKIIVNYELRLTP